MTLKVSAGQLMLMSKLSYRHAPVYYIIKSVTTMIVTRPCELSQINVPIILFCTLSLISDYQSTSYLYSNKVDIKIYLDVIGSVNFVIYMR